MIPYRSRMVTQEMKQAMTFVDNVFIMSTKTYKD